ncbi:MAG: UvrD-helicase domain-containing protein [Prevotella sp.]|nr:UvrD-helicase domain-containing protein [Prevotella sp.]
MNMTNSRDNKPQLTVYKASAGSGKTFRLAIEYIKLLIDNPQKYKNILAVTFTNKATEEMKSRILSQLYGLWKGAKSSQIYMDEVTSSLNMSPSKVSERAGIALKNLIHNYSYFHVETIDSFFQTILRNLARELDLSANLRLELNDNQVEELAVDMMIEKLTRNDVMLKWIIGYIEQNIEDDKSWNVIGSIKKFGKTIFKDYYKANSEQLKKAIEKKGFYTAYRKELVRIKESAQSEMAAFADRFENILERNHLQYDSFAGREKGIGSYFRKLRGNDFSDKKCLNATVEKCLGDAAKWTTKTSSDKELILQLAENELIPLLREAEQARITLWKNYLTADISLRHINELRLLGNIEKEVRELNEESNSFLLSDTQQFLHDLIDDSDSPFIFEKIGTALDHIMIDEFQDTSTIQWRNFQILLDETMSRDSYASHENLTRNLIVGDVKQSIYRWRSGDWKLLNNIETELSSAGKRIRVTPLNVNYRSCKNIVDFNNAFFEEARKIEFDNEMTVNPAEAEDLLHAYGDVFQYTPDGKKQDGGVKITLLPKQDYNENTLSMIADTVNELIEAGAKENEIAILVRANKHIPVIAEYFQQHQKHLKVISDEAFQLSFSLAVRSLVNMCEMIVHPQNMLARANVEKAYTLINDCDMPEITEEQRNELLRMPLIDMMEELFRWLHLDKLDDQSAYVCAFYDQLSSFTEEYGTDLEAFLQMWEDSIHKKTIHSSSMNGIRLMSIHKSKGLEFNYVIIPFCDWILELTSTLWCKSPDLYPYNQLPIMPVDYSGRLSETYFEKEYAHEHLQNCVDNLNLLYVAFTRAARNLFVIGKKEGKGTRSSLISSVIEKLTLDGATYQNDDGDNAPVVYEYGSVSVKKEDNGKHGEDNIFLRQPMPVNLRIESYKNHVEFMQSNRSRDFVKEEDSTEEHENQKRQQYIKIGNVMHCVFSQIKTTDDIPVMLRQLENDGILYDEDVSPKMIKDMLENRLSNPRVREWFSGRWKLFNECSIVYMDEQGDVVERRPDRVMTDGEKTIVVDFKFGREREEYHRQVSEYMNLLTSMGHRSVKGYLWYVYNNKIVEVKS